MTKIELHDESGDKEYFTILPNYIANHSTANDQSLYFQMKRFAGEKGKCFATEKTLMKKMGVGKKAYNKSLQYLLNSGWITYVGMTGGKTRPIKTYKLNNIWKLNNEHYKKISSESTLSKDKFQKQHKISSESTIEEEPLLRRTNNIDNTSYYLETERKDQHIIEIITAFKDINPSYGKFYNNKSQRSACDRLFKSHGLEKILNVIEILPQTNEIQYFPVINTPVQLEDKLASLYLAIKRHKQDNKGFARF